MKEQNIQEATAGAVSRSTYIISYWPNASLPWYVSARAYDEYGLPVPGRTLAECRDVKVAVGLVDRYVERGDHA